MKQEVAKQTDLEQHIGQDWKGAHNIWPNVKPKLGYWVDEISSYSPTAGGGSTWYDVTISSAPDNAVIIVKLTLHAEQAAAADWLYFRTRKKGSSEAYEGEIGGRAGGVGSAGYPDLAGQIEQVLGTDKKYQYSHDKSGWNVVTVKTLGYWVIPK